MGILVSFVLDFYWVSCGYLLASGYFHWDFGFLINPERRRLEFRFGVSITWVTDLLAANYKRPTIGSLEFKSHVKIAFAWSRSPDALRSLTTGGALLFLHLYCNSSHS